MAIVRRRKRFHLLIRELHEFLIFDEIDRAKRFVSLLLSANLLDRLHVIILPMPEIDQDFFVGRNLLVRFLFLFRRSRGA